MGCKSKPWDDTRQNGRKYSICTMNIKSSWQSPMKRCFLFTAAIGSLFTLATSALGGPFVQSWSQPLPTGAFGLAVQDLNGDSKPDLVSVDGNAPGTLTVATNAGNGLFLTNRTYFVGNGPYSVAIGDINGD